MLTLPKGGQNRKIVNLENPCVERDAIGEEGGQARLITSVLLIFLVGVKLNLCQLIVRVKVTESNCAASIWINPIPRVDGNRKTEKSESPVWRGVWRSEGGRKREKGEESLLTGDEEDCYTVAYGAITPMLDT